MCLIRVGRVVKVDKTKALCDFDGVLKEASSALFPNVKCGDDVVINSGFISDIVKNKKELYKLVILTDAFSAQILDEITKYSKILKQKELKVLNLSNINDYLIDKYSIRELLPKNINLISYSSNLDTFDTEEKLFLEISKKDSILLQGLISCSIKKATFFKEYLSKETFVDGILVFEQLIKENRYEKENIFVVKKSVTEVLESILALLKRLNKSSQKLEVKYKKSFK